ncbi:MAG: PKD repeat protein [Sphingobacteriales bacterium]
MSLKNFKNQINFKMKKNLFLTAAMLVSGGFLFAQSGGPDEYGYSWLDNTGTGGPTTEWIDIATKGTEVTGMGDDNVVGPFNLGFEFQYYWTKPKTFYVGSNGYISFERQVQHSSGQSPHFPDIPTPDFGGNHNFLAPFLADLNFGGIGNLGKVYYWTNNTDSLVVSFIDAAFWQDDALTYSGANSFQIVLSASDSSVQFNYLKQEGTYNSSYDPTQNAVVAGIENINGRIGLEIFDVLPTVPASYKFHYPEEVTFSVIDVKASYNQNPANRGFFALKDASMEISTLVANVGNTDVEAGFDLSGKVIESFNGTPNGPTLYSSNVRIASLKVEESRIVSQGSLFTPKKVGSVHLLTSTELGSDLNGDNDEIETEIVVIDTVGKSAIALSYVDEQPDGGFGFEGAGIVVTPPFYPITIDSIDVAMALADPNVASNAFRLKIYDDNGNGGSPGAILYDTLVSGDTVVTTSDETNPGIHMVRLDSVITIEDGSYYISWEVVQGEDITENTQIMTDLTGPFARNSFEFIGGFFGPARSGNTADIFMRSYVTIPPAQAASFKAAFSASALAGCVDADFNFFSHVADTSASHAWTFEGATTTTSSDKNPVAQWAAAGDYNVKLVITKDSLIDSISTKVSVDVVPFADFTPSADTVTLGTPVVFTNTSTASKLNAWDFRDANNRSYEESPTYTFSTTRKFNVKLEVFNACDDATVSKPIVVKRATGINENSALNNALKVYPNPSNSIVNIDANGLNIEQVEVYNLVGSLVKVINVSELTSIVTINSNDLAEGSYFVKVKADGQFGTTKFTVVK